MKRNNIVTIFSISLLLILVISATYAYFTSSVHTNINNENLISNVSGDAYLFDAIGGSFNMSITTENMLESLGNNTVAATAETNLIINFSAGNDNQKYACTYDIQFEWTSTDRYIAHSALNTESLKEFTLQATLSGANTNEGTNLIHNETDIATAVGSTNPKTIITGASVINKSSTVDTVAVWHIVAKFYNLATSQADLINKTYDARFKVTNISCDPFVSAADT